MQAWPALYPASKGYKTMKTLPSNYQTNVNILKENLKRGMSASQANGAIDHFENQFKQANLYGDNEQEFIITMRATVIEHFTLISVLTV